MNWGDIIHDMAQWQKQQFPKATCDSALAHIVKEVKELYMKPEDPEEWADVLHLAIQGGTKAAGSANAFKHIVAKKLQHNMNERQWPAEPAADNVYEHVKLPAVDNFEDFSG